MGLDELQSRAQALLEASLEGIFSELQGDEGKGGDISPDLQSEVDRHVDSLSWAIAKQVSGAPRKPHFLYLNLWYDVMNDEHRADIEDESGVVLTITEDDMPAFKTAGLDPYVFNDVFAYANHLLGNRFQSMVNIGEEYEGNDNYNWKTDN